MDKRLSKINLKGGRKMMNGSNINSKKKSLKEKVLNL
jgi:hypothetical protein